MPDIAALDSTNLATPRSPASISTESSRCGSFKPIRLSARDSEQCRVGSPPGRLTRKRAAILDTERSTLSQGVGDLVIHGASTIVPPPPDPTREQVCLCQPDPKIPRPRNAFILYRQHYQAQVIAQNPGLANPEISKIIGEQWRDQAPEVKNDWKRLAEEEKQRHRRQYPGYRYQPRRSGKTAGIRSVSGSHFSDEPGRCPKCSGRYISTPSTPLTPLAGGFEAGYAPRTQQLPPLLTPAASRRNQPLKQSTSLSQMHSTRMNSPQAPSFHQHGPCRAPYLQSLQTHHEKDEDMDLLLSPSADHKRRRYNHESQSRRGYPSPSPVSFSPSQQHSRSGFEMSGTSYRAQQFLPYSRPPTTGPTPQQSPITQQPRHLYPPRSEAFDESLRLPPLQTQVPEPGQNSLHKIDVNAENRDVQAKSIEAMVMTIPYINKIKVLTKISPPLMPPGIGSPVQQIRGAIIAVEGADRTLSSEVGAFIYEHLSRDSSCAVRTWSISNPAEAISAHGDTEMAGTDSTSSNSLTIPTDTATGDPFIEYLSIISEWHKKSPEITQYISTPPTLPTKDSSNTNGTHLPTLVSKTIPIALLPHGFSLTTSDTHALRIPINDSYAPVDHWQWMATLWRGIIGPDLTIYVKRVDREEMDRHGGVETRRDCAAIVVRVPNAERLEEKTARRLGFEVLEFVRSVEAGLGHGMA